ncbi:hypothetical protein M427DRAFT_55455 [Gonapodya prolifera JEL478]|uniref:Uncharacterized protein n=1 Tax=Gonapodya prolifera (strain JEL478) TaxID=1344416 RepID=A0A139AJ67_GONPJ|nr:hypothetical protein M427DRAFT_55455 [Gonapodya prolifera JEL478]|eukprot:KXS16503.1 hypothetical protein M427DRAFT_55455 [Gonapodya prolifera JEL478]
MERVRKGFDQWTDVYQTRRDTGEVQGRFNEGLGTGPGEAGGSAGCSIALVEMIRTSSAGGQDGREMPY